NPNTQLQRRQPHFLASQLYTGDRCLHFQRREARVNRVPAIAPEHTANRHISVTDRLELLQSVTGDDAVERREILIEETDERCWLGSFGQQREALEIGEQNGRRARVFWLHLAVFPEFVGDCCRQ